MTRKRIAIVAHDIHFRGGMERHLAEVVSRLQHDYEVLVLANTFEMETNEHVQFVPVKTVTGPFPLRYLLFSITASLKLQKMRADLVHTTGAIVWNKVDLSTVHFCHAGYVRECGDTRTIGSKSLLRRLNSGIATTMSLWMEKYSYRPGATRKLIAVSNRVKRELLDSFPYDDRDVVVVPNGVDIDRFHVPRADEKQELRRQNGLPEHGSMMLFMGGDWERKGLQYVIEAFNELAVMHPDSFVAVVGKGDPKPYRDRLLPELRSRVHFAGIQRNAEDWFAMADLFVSPSSYETFSLVVHEAAASGLPVVSTNVGGVEDFIVEGETGLYIERDTASVKKQIGLLLASPSLRRALGLAARAKVECLTWDNTYAGLKQLYDEQLFGKTAAAEGEYRHELRHP